MNALVARMSLRPSNASIPSGAHSGLSYRPDIDGLRALAIIPVVIFHAFPAIMPGGFVGVDIFLVISGFLISRILLQALQRETFSFVGFYSNRIHRIFPALVVVLAACFAAGWFFLLPDEYTHLGKHIVGAVAYIENFILRREAGYFDLRSFLKPLMHLWSLGIEEQFYLTYPLFLWLVWRFRRNLLAILLSLAVISFWLNIRQVHRDPVGDFFLPQTRCWELMVGGAIACWQLVNQPARQRRWVQIPGPAVRNAFSAFGMLLIVIAVLRIHDTDMFPGWWALLPVGGAGLLIVGGPGAWINREILANPAMILVGLISYPLYLWHWPILTFPRILRGGELPVAGRCGGIVLSVVLAWFTWRFIESPIRTGRKTLVTSAALVALSLVIGSVGYLAYSRDGFMGRFPDLLRDLGQLREVRWSTPECRQRVGRDDVNYCRALSTAAPDVLLIGDSHAAVLFDGLAPEYQKRSQILMNLGQAGCVPFYDTESYSQGMRHQNCKPVVNRIIDFAGFSSSVRTIILSLRGPRYMSGQGFGPVEAGAAPKEILWEGAAKNAGQAEMFAGAMRNTISRLYATGKNLILIVDWPELGFDPRSCVSRPVALFSRPREFCGVPRAQVESRNRPYLEVIRSLKRDFPRLRLVDPMPYLCDSSACYAMRAGHFLYSDDNHISNAGAIYLSGKFFEDKSLEAEVPPPPVSECGTSLCSLHGFGEEWGDSRKIVKADPHS